MPKLTAESFLSVLKQSGLLDKELIKRIVVDAQQAGINVQDSDALAGYFVQRELLTNWQVDKLQQGKHKGFTLGKYRLLRLLGKGGMSSVYLAEHVLMRRRCAIKVLPIKRVNDSSYLARFHREAQAVASLDHPNIVRAYDIDHEVEKDTEIHFLVMEYVNGKSIQEILRDDGPLSIELTAAYIAQAALGLDHAHKAGLVHRDVKPGNLLVDQNGVVKLLDLGLALFAERTEENPLTVTHDEKVLGTADYLSPEQALDSHLVDLRADIYSLGCTIYFCLTGLPPFRDGTLAQRLMWHQTKEPPSIAESRPDIPADFLALVSKMMAKKPDDRFQTMAQVADALIAWLHQHASPTFRQDWSGLMGGSGTNLNRPASNSVVTPSTSATLAAAGHAVANTTQAPAAPVMTATVAAVVQDPMIAADPSPSDSGFSGFFKQFQQPAAAPAPAQPTVPTQAPVLPWEQSEPARSEASSLTGRDSSGVFDLRREEPRQLTDTQSFAGVAPSTPMAMGAPAVAASSTDFLSQLSAPAVPVAASPVAAVPVVASVVPVTASPVAVASVATPVAAAPVAVSAVPVAAAAIPVTAQPVSVPVMATAVPVAAMPVAPVPVPAAPVAVAVAAPAVAVASLPVNPAPVVTAAPAVAAPVVMTAPAPVMAASPVVAQAATAPTFAAPVPAFFGEETVEPETETFAWSPDETARVAPVTAPVAAVPVAQAPQAAAPVAQAWPTNQQPVAAYPEAAPTAYGMPYSGQPADQYGSSFTATSTPGVAQPVPAVTAKKPFPAKLAAIVGVLVAAIAAGGYFAFAPANSNSTTKPNSKGGQTVKDGGKKTPSKEPVKVAADAPPREPQPTAKPVPNKEVGGGKVIDVGPEGHFKEIADALAYVRAEKKKFSAAGAKGGRFNVKLNVTGGQAYDAFAIDNVDLDYPSGIHIIANGNPAKLKPRADGLAVRLLNVEGFRMENFEIDVEGKNSAIEVVGYSTPLFSKLTLKNYSQAGILGTGLAGNNRDQATFDQIKFLPAGEQAVGFKANKASSFDGKTINPREITITNCRFIGPHAAAIEFSASGSNLMMRENVFDRADVGVKFANQGDWNLVLFGNNTFHACKKAGIEFAGMPKSSGNLVFHRNLFAKCGGPELLVSDKFQQSEFETYIYNRNNTKGIEHNVTDRKTAADAAKGEFELVTDAKQRGQAIAFVNSDPNNPDFLALPGNSPLAAVGTPNNMLFMQAWVGARSKK